MKCSETRSIHESYIFPADLNNNSIQFGGRTLEILDATAGLSIIKFVPGLKFVTASYDHVHFFSPIRTDDIVECVCYVTGVRKRAIEVFCKFVAMDKMTKEKRVCFLCFTTLMVTEELPETGLPSIEPESDEEKYLVATFPERSERRRSELQESKDVLANLSLD
ncbi:hotdog domain-containing protein [Lentilactobacillus sp. Marseille-Q4993]|uniref:acyl-CoA thioesterase n=1 Tax=Lentilactobacillus sp. Marseille-Q4993 TaxID=3039492 RepID=UPI0024BCB6CB|nr:hotdog domain-containing protein [Lentilactobacillus sp. Marseille-Q4993]